MSSERHTAASSLPEVQNAHPHVRLRKYKADRVTHIFQRKETSPSKGEWIQIRQITLFLEQREGFKPPLPRSSARAESESRSREGRGF